MGYLKRILEQLGEERMDAAYTAHLARQLEAVKARTYDVKYPELKARTLLPIDRSVPPGAESIMYYQWDEIGMAQLVANYADDLPMADALAQKFTSAVHSLGEAYQYSIQDLRRTAMAGTSLDARRASAARRAIERKFDDLAATGDAAAKLYGFLNHPNVPVYTAANDGTSTRWVGGRGTPKTPANIQKDMHTLVANIRNSTKEIHSPDTLLLSSTEFGHIAQTPVGTDNQTTILKSFLANSPWIRNVESWYKLDTGDVAGTGPRMVAYMRDPEVVEFCVPQEFEQLPPQARNLAFVVPCHARVGGVKFYYPLSAAYMDGI